MAAASLLLAACNCGKPPPPTPDNPPEWPEGALVTLTDTTETSATLSWPEATDDVGVVAYRLEVPDAPPQDVTATTQTLENLSPGQHLRVAVRAVDTAGQTSAPLYAEVAPVPKEVVPDGDLSADFCAANQFLVKGQAIPCATFSVLTGRVLSSEGAGVPALRVSLLGHGEFGAALTRVDGTFALAVPAGAWTLDIRAAAFLPAQRWVTAQAGDYTPLENAVAVLRRDEAMTKLETSAGGFHRSTPRKDKDGSRQVALYLPPGTSASLYFADGGTQPTDTVSLRVTEATVGNLGPEAMPASLPAASAYTFMADFSADEAVAAGADGVRFALAGRLLRRQLPAIPGGHPGAPGQLRLPPRQVGGAARLPGGAGARRRAARLRRRRRARTPECPCCQERPRCWPESFRPARRCGAAPPRTSAAST